ncbi:MAG: Na+/H+ antiporter subunit E [Halioglobus sp.]
MVFRNPNARIRGQQRGASRTAAMLLLLAVLMVAWLVWSGLYKPLLLVLGFLSCVLCVYLANRMGFFERLALVKVMARLPGYWVWLLKEVIVSSWDVARTILHPKMPISPTVVEIDAGSDSEAVQVILANSITLSPGTVTLDMHKGKLKVHCLTRAGAEALLAGEAQRRAMALENE